MSRPLLTFSTLSLVYGKQQQQDGKQQQQDGKQQQQEKQQQPVEKKKIKIKLKNTVVVVASTTTITTTTSQEECSTHSHSCEKVNECKETTHSLPLVPLPLPVEQKKKIIIIKKRENVEEKRSYNDIAPPATMICNPQSQSDYKAPPQRCCRFFIENKHCFLRERDNACISPISKTVFGFWNEKVGKECKLLPIEDETTYEEEMSEIPLLSSPVMKSKSQKSPKKIDLITKSPKKVDLITKSRFVSDAQRARVAYEPVAILREKIAKQYGMIKKN
jgi:hypothetical protein